MKILVLNGSPRPRGNTAAMVEAFTRGAEESGHEVSVVAVCQKKIAGCLGCEYCHTKGEGHCIQKDDMQAVYPLFQEAELLVLASPVYYFGFTGQLQCAISRLYAPGRSRCLKKTALMLSSGSDDVYEGAIYSYRSSFADYLGLEDLGVFTAFGAQNRSEELLNRLYEFGKTLR